jgi:hypothetical protein
MTHPISTLARRLPKVLGVAAFLLPTLVLAQYSSPVRDVENAAHSPLRLGFLITVPNGATSTFNYFAANVPAGKRMVVEFVSMICEIAANQGVNVATMDFITFTGGEGFPVPMPVTKSITNGDGVNRYFTSQLVQFYADGVGATIGAGVALSGPAPGKVDCFFTLSGHTVNLP